MNQKNRYRILVVDDDARLRELLSRYLQEQGFSVKAVGDAPMMDRALHREHYDLIVLDLMLPGEDGLSICRRLRAAENQIPVIMLTAKGDDVDRIVGLEMGADDYVAKPFNPRELVARIQAVMRRQPHTLPGAPTPAAGLDEMTINWEVGTRLATTLPVARVSSKRPRPFRARSPRSAGSAPELGAQAGTAPVGFTGVRK